MPFAAALAVPPWAVVPFALTLVGIALLPLAAPHFWHSDRNRLLFVLVLAGPVAGYLVLRGPAGRAALGHELHGYASFVVLLGSLYAVAGGISLTGDIEARPATNTAFLALGAGLANLIGTTGASMVLVRPLLRINSERDRRAHLPVFFIFVVSNTGGLLTPLGDPPLFLGYTRGVPFFWTLSLWPQWLFANGLLLLAFFAWDSAQYRRESAFALRMDRTVIEPLRLRGLWPNGVLLAGILAAVVALPSPWGEAAMAACGGLSLALTPAAVRKANDFTWAPMREVAVLFLGVFVTMVPALALLDERGRGLGVTEPWQFFWLTGLLSAVLDNAPTYLSFATLAAEGRPFAELAADRPRTLAAVACGAVFFGSGTYIGNGPNFMVKALAEEAGYPVPSFFGYAARAALVLGPVLLLTTAVFFR